MVSCSLVPPEQEREPGNIEGGQTVDFQRLGSGRVVPIRLQNDSRDKFATA